MISEEKVQQLAKKIQLEIKKEEMPTYLKKLVHLEAMLANFRKVNLPKKTKRLLRINTGYLTKKNLEDLVEEFSSPQNCLFSSNYFFISSEYLPKSN